MRQAVVNAWKITELRRKILFTLGMLLVFRLIAHIPVPHVDLEAIKQATQSSDISQILGLLNLFSGGALSQFSVAAMGVYPYITASIIMQLLTPLIPALQELSKEGEQGRNRINRYTYWLTVPLAYLQGYGQTLAISRTVPLFGQGFVFDLTENFFPTFTILTMMVAGSMVLIWMGELIDEKGIGNGLSIIIFGGIVARFFPIMYQGFQQTAGVEAGIIRGIMLLAIALATVVGIVLITEGQRRIPVQYARRVRGNKVYGGQASYVPLKINMAGMIPLIFAQSILILPSTIASYIYDANGTGVVNSIAGFFVANFGQSTYSLLYTVLLFLFVVGFTFFYTLVLFQQQNLSESLQRNGGFIPGIRPGRSTDQYLLKIVNRITLVGALFLGLVAAMPFLAQQISGLPLGVSSTALLIVVGVAVDTMRQLEAQLLMRNYEGFISR